MAQGLHLTLSEAERARVERVDALGALGDERVPQLIEMLSDPSWTVRRSVVATLASLGEAAAHALAQSLISARHDETRLAAAVDALVASTADVESIVAPLAENANGAVAADAAQILGRRRNPRSTRILVRLASHRDDNVAVAALEALGRIGGRAAVEPLVGAVTSGNFFRTFPAIDVLGRSGDPRAIPPLTVLLANPQYAFEAARALGKTGDAAAAEPLVEFLSQPSDSALRVGAVALAELHARSLRRYGDANAVERAIRSAATDARGIVRRITRVLASSDEAEQVALCLVLGCLDQADAVPALAQLVDEDGPAASAAAAALTNLRRTAQPQLVRALADGGSGRRRALLPLVSRSSALSEVVSCLTDADPVVRTLACEALARIGDASVVRHLFSLLVDPNPAVVQAAVGAIQSLGSAETESLALSAAESRTPTVRRAAHRILAWFGYPSATEVLLRAVHDDDVRIRESALHGLALLDDDRAQDALFKSMQAEDARTRAGAIRALGTAGGGLRVTSQLIRALRDSDPWARYYACQALGRLRAEEATGPIANLLRDPAGQVRVAAVESLSHMESEAAMGALRAAARDPDVDVHRAAIVGLGIAQRRDSLPVLLEAATSPDAATRVVALSALSAFSGPEVVRALAVAATDSDENVRSAAMGFLARQESPDATAELINLFRKDGAREDVLDALAFGGEARIDGILQGLASADDELAPHLTAAIVRTKHPRAEDALLEAFGSANVAARKAAASSLHALGGPKAISALQRGATEDADAEVRRICALLLSR